MKALALSFAAILALSLTSPLAAAGPAKDKSKKDSKAGLQKRILEQFDANGNGKLEPDEQAAARKAAAERRKNKKKAAQDPGGQGVDPQSGLESLNGLPIGAGTAGSVGDGRAKLLKRFDFNRDGRLSAAEMSRAREWMQKNSSAGQMRGQLPQAVGDTSRNVR